VSGVGYVLTHHPRASQTFIDAELRAIERSGEHLTVFAMNEPAQDQVVGDDAIRWRATTVYLKAAGPRGAAAAAAHAVWRRPAALAGTTLLAMRTSARSPKALMRRLAHLAEALIVWDRARLDGVDRLHAHFAQAPSTIAWLACDLGRRTRQGPTSYSITIHGLGEMARPDEDLPAEKLAGASVVRFVCDAARRHFEQLGRAATTRVVRCGIDLDRFALRAARPVGQPPRILMVGRLTQAKGQRDAVHALSVMHRQGVAAELALVGGGDDEDELRRIVGSTRLTGAVHFLGELPPTMVRDELGRADALCLPSYDEGLPVAIIEALAVGCPVVATAIAGIPELIVNGDSGRLIQPGDVAALADAMTEAVTDSPTRQRWITAGRAAVEAHHDQQATLVEFLALLEIAQAKSATRSVRS